MVTLTRRAAMAAGISSLLLTTFASKLAAQEDGEKTVVRLAATKASNRLDPHIDVKWEVLMVLSAVYDTLVYQDAEGNIVPGLAASWTVSDDGLEYVFDLRDGVTFHDGTVFDAEAVKYNFDRIKALGPKSYKASSLIADVETVEVTSPLQVKLVMKQANSSLLFNLALTYVAMVSPTAAEQYGDEYHLNQVGTGPFKFTEIELGDHYTLVKNPDYAWAPAIYGHDGPALVDELEWRFLPEPSSRSVALLAGDFDIVFDLLPTSLKRVESSSDYETTYSRLSGQPAYWFFNTELAPTNDIAVRKALIQAVDMESGVKAIMRGVAPKADGPLSKVTAEYAPEVEGMYPYDPEAAAATLEAAGWTMGADGVREKDGEKLVLKVQMAGWGNSESFSILLQSQLKEIGVAVELEMMAYMVGIEAGKNGTHNLLFTGGSGFAAADSMLPYFLSENTEAGFAFSKMKDPELDELMYAAQAATSLDERKALFQQAQIRVMEEALILPIYDYALAIGVTSKLDELNFGATGLVPNVYEIDL